MPSFSEEDREIIVDFVNESSEAIEKTEVIILKLEAQNMNYEASHYTIFY